jgi:hypothetical protein
VHSVQLLSALKYPASQRQSAAETDPGALNSVAAQAWHATLPSVECVSAGHVSHARMALPLANEPAAHVTHGALPADFALPGAHAAQAKGSAVAPKPAAQVQLARAVEPAAEKLFAGQAAHALEPAPACASAGHCWHAALPAADLNVPAAHGAHGPPSGPLWPASQVQLAGAAPAGAALACAGHGRQAAAAAAPGLGWYVSSGQGLQLVWFASSW